jgi:hypothetical protein
MEVKMENRKNCSRCGGRMFLEFDYDTRRYDFVCISCGHLELSAPLVSQPEPIAHPARKIEALTHV